MYGDVRLRVTGAPDSNLVDTPVCAHVHMRLCMVGCSGMCCRQRSSHRSTCRITTNLHCATVCGRPMSSTTLTAQGPHTVSARWKDPVPCVHALTAMHVCVCTCACAWRAFVPKALWPVYEIGASLESQQANPTWNPIRCGSSMATCVCAAVPNSDLSCMLLVHFRHSPRHFRYYPS